MNLVERYASDCGLKINKPFLYQKYFPIPFDKYILIHAGGNFLSKRYDYYNEVVELIFPILKENGYKLVQIGSENDSELHSIADLRGKTSIHQTAYLIRKAALLIGNDSFCVHVAAAHNTPTITLFGSTSPHNHGAYFGSQNNKKFIQADLKGLKPSFSAQDEGTKVINRIKPEEVANTVLELLKLDKKLDRKTLFIGEKYNDFIIEVVMDTVVSPNSFPQAMLGARMDLNFDEEMLEKNLQIRPLSITTDRPINIDLLSKYRQHVGAVIYEIKEDYSVDFAKNLMMNAIKLHLFTYLPEDKLGLIKLDLFDYGIIDVKEKFTLRKFEDFKKTIENDDNKLTYNTKYKTMKFLAADNKWYLNEIDWKNNKPIENLEKNQGKIDLKNPYFWDNLDYIYIYNE